MSLPWQHGGAAVPRTACRRSSVGAVRACRDMLCASWRVSQQLNVVGDRGTASPSLRASGPSPTSLRPVLPVGQASVGQALAVSLYWSPADMQICSTARSSQAWRGRGQSQPGPGPFCAFGKIGARQHTSVRVQAQDVRASELLESGTHHPRSCPQQNSGRRRSLLLILRS